MIDLTDGEIDDAPHPPPAATPAAAPAAAHVIDLTDGEIDDSGAAAATAAEAVWACSMCTLDNEHTSAACAACDEPRTTVAMATSNRPV